MDVAAVWEITASVLVSLGGGGLIVFGLSTWLGKVWADRLMQKEQAAYSAKLEELRSSLSFKNSEQMERLSRQLDIAVQTHQREVQDKLAIYREVVDRVAEVFALFDRTGSDGKQPDDAKERVEKFNRERMRLYGYMAMLAPQPVMDACDALTDYLLLIINGRDKYEWPRARQLSLALLNAVRSDIGINKTPVVYRGTL
jgi:hypothetical protein